MFAMHHIRADQNLVKNAEYAANLDHFIPKQRSLIST